MQRNHIAGGSILLVEVKTGANFLQNNWQYEFQKS